jgi:glutamine synthetase
LVKPHTNSEDAEVYDRLAAIRDSLESRRISQINLQFTDVAGTVKAVTIPTGQLDDAVTHGTWFDGSSLDSLARTVESDMYLMPDLSTFAIGDWSRSPAARVICSVHTTDGAPDPGDPRRALQAAAQRAQALGFDYQVGPEIEFYVLHRASEGGAALPLANDEGGYFDFSTDLGAAIRHEAVDALASYNVDINTTHQEVGPGQHEIDLGHTRAVAAADAMVTLRYVLKGIAHEHDALATFMPKPFADRSGSGLHVHQSLLTLQGENAFYDEGDDYGISDVARYFIAGQLHHARAMTAVLAPLVNSYKRFGRGFEAPIFVSWARTNRGALIRVPQVGREEATRVELRSPDPSCNPYLAFAVMLQCGLDGIERELTLPAAIEESLWGADEDELRRQNIEPLPSSLSAALELFRHDDVLRAALGDQICERFVESKQLEWDEYRRQVTPWELRSYLDRI